MANSPVSRTVRIVASIGDRDTTAIFRDDEIQDIPAWLNKHVTPLSPGKRLHDLYWSRRNWVNFADNPLGAYDALSPTFQLRWTCAASHIYLPYAGKTCYEGYYQAALVETGDGAGKKYDKTTAVFPWEEMAPNIQEAWHAAAIEYLLSTAVAINPVIAT